VPIHLVSEVDAQVPLRVVRTAGLCSQSFGAKAAFNQRFPSALSFPHNTLCLSL
jgi:hypothetical protein